MAVCLPVQAVDKSPTGPDCPSRGLDSLHTVPCHGAAVSAFTPPVHGWSRPGGEVQKGPNPQWGVGPFYCVQFPRRRGKSDHGVGAVHVPMTKLSGRETSSATRSLPFIVTTPSVKF